MRLDPPPPTNGKISTLCREFERGMRSPFDVSQVLEQFGAEWDKRLEGWIFESVFRRALIRAVPDSELLAENWSFIAVDGRPRHWFKIELPSHPLTKCDEVFIELLRNLKCTITLVGADPISGQLTGRHCGDEGWKVKKPLLDVVRSLAGVRREPVSYSEPRESDSKRMQLALKFIQANFTHDQLTLLSINRLLINCYLAPWFGYQPLDLDVCVMIDDEIKIIEFKQKYPFTAGAGQQRQLRVGLDRGHHDFRTWLAKSSVPYLYILLVNPLWKEFKDQSPLHLLAESSLTADHIVWMGLRVTDLDFAKELAQTSGYDSGRSGRIRTQRTIPVRRFRDLGTGPSPAILHEFLVDPDNAGSTVVESHLRKANADAEAAFQAEPTS